MLSVPVARFCGKVSLENLIPDLQPGKHERHGPCPFCGGSRRFVVFLDSQRGLCHTCDWRGDAIQLLRDRDGLTFSEAKRVLGLDTYTAPAVKKKATVHSLALAAAKREYRAWQQRIFNALCEHYRDLTRDCDEAEIAYRALLRVPEQYTHEEKVFWTRQCAVSAADLALVEFLLDLFTYDAREAERIALWRKSEVRHG
jgi:hypothetical protein